MAQNNIGQSERTGRDFSVSAITGENEARLLIDEIENNDRDDAKRVERLKKAGTWSPEDESIERIYQSKGDEVYDAYSEALERKSEDGSFTEADSENLTKKLAEYREAARLAFNRDRGGKTAGKKNAEPVSAQEKIDSTKSAGITKEEEVLRGIESELATDQVRLQYCENSYRQIIDSGMEIAFDEEMSERLNQFVRSINYMQKTLNALVKIKDEMKSKFSSSEQIPDGEIADIYERLDKLGENLEGFESYGVSISKKIEEKSMEQLDLRDQLAKLEARLQERKKKGKFADEKTKILNDSLIQKINKLRDGVARGSKLVGSEVSGLEDLAEKQILAPEERADVNAERMDLFFKIRPRLRKEEAEIQEMNEQMIWAGKREKTSPPKMRELFSKAGKKFAEAVGLNNLLLRAVSLEINPPLDEVKEQLKEYDETLPEMRKLYNKMIPEIKAMKMSDLWPKFMSAERGLAEKKLNVEQRAMMEGWKSIMKSGDVTLEELDEIADSLEEKIIAPLKQTYEQESAATRDKMVTAMRGREAEKKFEQEGDEMNAPQKKEFVPPKKAPKKRGETEEEMTEWKELGGEAPTRAEKGVVRIGVKEMLAESGVIEIDPQQIMDLLSDEEMRMLVSNVRKDIAEKSDKNRDAFHNVLRDALNENIFKELEKEARDEMLKSVSAQTYTILRDAVNAEVESQLLKARSGEASKLAKMGKVGAKLVAGVAMAAGIGIGAAMIIGSGGAAAAVAGVSIVAAREMNKRIAKSEIFQRAKEKAGSFWDRTVGKLFKKEKPEIDEEQMIKDISEKIATREKLAVILSNQIRENSSRDIVEQINFFAEQKQEAVNHPSPETSAKFESALDNVSKEFYRKALKYVSMEYAGKNLPEEELARMAMMMTLTIGQNQRGDVAAASALAELEKKVKLPEERNWFLDKAEKFFKIRSAGIGAAVFGGGMAYAVAETSSVGRVVSGAIAGAGLGLMIEKKFRVENKEKLAKIIDKLISETEKKLKGKEAGALTETELNEAKKNSAYVRAQLDAGAFEGNDVLLNRAENFVSRINKLSLERMEQPFFDIDDLLSDISASSRQIEKEAKKNIDRVSKISKDKKALVFMAAGAVVGGALGYLGTQLSQYLRAPAGKTITPTEHDLGGAGVSRSGDYEITPLEKAVPPATPLQPLPPETPLRPIHEFAAGGGVHQAGIREALETAAGKITEHGPAVSVVHTAGGQPVEVYELYSASIKDINNPQPVFFTREENIELEHLMQEKEAGGKIFDFVERAHERGQIYEDASGRQYHANELDFTPEKKIVNPYDLEEPKAGKGAGIVEEPKTPRAPKIKNPYADEDLYKKGQPSKPSSSDKLDTYEDVYGKSKTAAGVRHLDSAEEVYGAEEPKTKLDTYEDVYGKSNIVSEKSAFNGPAEGAGAHEPVEIEQIRFEDAGKDIITPEPVETPVIDYRGRGATPIEEPPTHDATPGKSSGPTDAEVERGRILKEIEERKHEQAVEEEEISESPEVEKIVAQRELTMVSQLESPKAKSAYNWLDEQADNKNLSIADRDAVKGLKEDFVKDMVGDRKIEPSLLRKITLLQKKIGQ